MRTSTTVIKTMAAIVMTVIVSTGGPPTPRTKISAPTLAMSDSR